MKSIQKIIAVFAVLMCMVNSGGESATNAPKFEGKKVTVKAVYVYEAISEQTENTLVAVKGKLASTEDIKKALANLPEGVLIYLDLSGVTGLTEIGKEAFKEESNTFHHLAGIVLPNSVTQIGDWAFGGCTSLESVTIPNSVTQIEGYAFSGCTALESVTIPNSITQIGYAAFYECTSLVSVTIPDSVTQIGDGAFFGCTSLESVTILNSVTQIGEYVFNECDNLVITFEGTERQWDNALGDNYVSQEVLFPNDDKNYYYDE